MDLLESEVEVVVEDIVELVGYGFRVDTTAVEAVTGEDAFEKQPFEKVLNEQAFGIRTNCHPYESLWETEEADGGRSKEEW
jgi:hypothetical protein